jgi:hypothetical protein
MCMLGALHAGNSSACRFTCSTYASSSSVTVDGNNHTVVPAARIVHGAAGVQTCANAVYGYSGDINLHCAMEPFL